ncbi:DUF4743 domain-containing protein [Methylibium petroleiphilum]
MSDPRLPASETPPDPRRDFLAIDAAQRHDAAARRPLHLGGRAVGSVAAGALPVLRAHAPWLQEREDGVLSTALRDEALDAAFAVTHAALRERGLITDWRNETYAVVPAWGAPVLARIERAAARFWGTLTFGAHANGYVAGPDGRPSHLWIAQRSPHKPTDPGKFDNLIGGGVPHGQTPFETLVREGWEEAGLAADLVRRATRGRVIDLQRALPDCAGHGLQREQLFVYDLALPPGVQPCNQDGEVASLQLLPVAEALALAGGDTMTVDAALATLDFALRWRLLGEREHAALTARTAGLFGAMPD